LKTSPLLMKGPLVRRSLAGRKTETRRIILPQPFLVWSYTDHGLYWQPEGEASRTTPCPYGGAGDRLWVRETWQAVTGKPGDLGAVIRYRDMSIRSCFMPEDSVLSPGLTWDKWHPSIFMRRWACRLELEIVAVRIERIQDITPESALAEGVTDLTLGELVEMGFRHRQIVDTVASCGPTLTDGHTILDWFGGDAVRAFRCVWDLVNASRPECAWADNPWVWVISYRRVANAGV
jgi:hypothetical protein